MDQIASATGRTVEDFLSGAVRGAVDQRDALLGAWDAIRTEGGRRRALAVVIAIAEEEDRSAGAP